MLTFLRVVLWPFLALGMLAALPVVGLWCGAIAVYRGMDWIITEAVLGHGRRRRAPAPPRPPADPPARRVRNDPAATGRL